MSDSEIINGVNVALLKKLYEWARASSEGLDKFFENNPRFAKHRQSVWGRALKNGTCQTAFCLAGQTAVHSGFTFVVNDDSEWSQWAEDGHTYRETGNDGSMVRTDQVHELGLKFIKGTKRTFAHANTDVIAKLYDYNLETDDIVQAPQVAQEVLGISDWEADSLFSGSNDLNDIEVYINQIFTNHGISERVGSGKDSHLEGEIFE